MSWLSKHASDVVAPVFSLPAKAIEKVTGLSPTQQLEIGAGVGAAGGLMGMVGGSSAGAYTPGATPGPWAPYRDWETDRKSTRLNSSHSGESRMPSSA